MALKDPAIRLIVLQRRRPRDIKEIIENSKGRRGNFTKRNKLFLSDWVYKEFLSFYYIVISVVYIFYRYVFRALCWRGERGEYFVGPAGMRARWAYLSDKSSLAAGSSEAPKRKGRLSHDNSSRSPRIIFHTSIHVLSSRLCAGWHFSLSHSERRAQLVSICIQHKSKPCLV